MPEIASENEIGNVFQILISISGYWLNMYIHKSLKEKEAECKALLLSTGRPKVEALISHIERMGYFIAPGSLKHHRFEGGLVSHSLETYHKAMELRAERIAHGGNPDSMPEESVIIATLMHDLCKADALRYSKETHKSYSVKKTHGHSARSVRQVGYSGFELTPAEKDAILWHMGGSKFPEDKHDHFRKHPLAAIVFYADKSSIAEASLRHRRKSKA